MILKGTLRDWSAELQAIGHLRREWLQQHRFNVIARLSERRLTISEYRTWCNIQRRCNNPKSQGFEYYGGRGIKSYFLSAYSMIKSIGHKPHGPYSIDRIDSDGHYEPSNVQWLLASENSRKASKRRGLVKGFVSPK